MPGKSLVFSLLYYLTIVAGFLGLTLGAAGSAALLCRRLKDPALRNYSGFADYLNLSLFLSFFGFGFLAWLFTDIAFEGARAYVYSLLTFGRNPTGMTVAQGIPGCLTIILASLLVGYVPLTHMSHMFMKYFLYHAVRWEDTPNLKGSKIEAAILANLGFKPTWAAPHVGADGKKTWADIAASTKKEQK